MEGRTASGGSTPRTRRWELKPGSTFYAVWTRQQQNTVNSGDFALGRDARVMFAAPGDDVFLVKMAYWIGR